MISVLISRERNKCSTIEEAIAGILPKLKGGYSLLVMTPRKVIGVRDPRGIRPLVFGRKKNSMFFSSETCAFDELGVTFEREVEPGEILVAGEKGVYSLYIQNDEKPAVCAFEYVYHSRPDSVLGGTEVFAAREAMGREMACQAPASVDAVVWVPDSGLRLRQAMRKKRDCRLWMPLLKISILAIILSSRMRRCFCAALI